MSLINSYTKVASEYSKRMYNELEGKPKDRELLSLLAKTLGPDSKLCDLGCGPGQVSSGPQTA